MTFLILLGIVSVLFIAAFITKRRFGVLGLALSGGALLANNINQEVADFFERNSIGLGTIPHDTLAQCFLILLPAVLLLLGGPKYQKSLIRIVGSAAFAILAGLLLLGPLSEMINATGMARDVLLFFATYQSALIAIGVALAVADTLLLHSPKFGKKRD